MTKKENFGKQMDKTASHAQEPKGKFNKQNGKFHKSRQNTSENQSKNFQSQKRKFSEESDDDSASDGLYQNILLTSLLFVCQLFYWCQMISPFKLLFVIYKVFMSILYTNVMQSVQIMYGQFIQACILSVDGKQVLVSVFLVH